MLRRSLAAVALVAFGAAACGGSSGGSSGGDASSGGPSWPSTSVTYVTDWHEYYSTWYAEVKVNGRDCIEIQGDRENSISCDWTPASPAPR